MNKTLLSLALAAAFPCVALPAFAASASAADAQATLPAVSITATQDASLAAPVSTGSGLGLTPLQTPASVSTLTREQLSERGDASLVDAITRSPGISSLAHPGNGGSSLSARGFTDTTSVMRLYDGMRQYGGVGVTFPFDTWSVERVEVLRGPASVVYGDGAIGGVVNVIPKKPAHGPIENEVQATLGTDRTQRLDLGSGGAINDKLSYRLDLSGDRSDGWVDRGDSRNRTISGAVQLDVSPEFSLKLSHAQGRQNPMRYFGTPLVDGRQLPALREKNYNVGDSAIRYDDRWSELAAQWTPGADMSVRSRLYRIESTRYWRNAEAYAYSPRTGLIDRSGNTEILHNQSQTGNTTDATFKGRLFGLKNQASVGFDVNTSSFTHTNNTYVGASPSVDPLNPVPGVFYSSVPFIPRYTNEARQSAVFAEDRLELSERWSLIGGLRHDHARISRRDLVAGTPSFDKSFSNTGWRIGTVFEIVPNLALYAQFAKAADPVGGLLMLSPANSKFALSTGKQAEVGLKQAFWGQRGEWTLAAYHITKNNLVTRDPGNPAQSIQVGQRSSKGIEATLAMAFASGWQLDANASLLRARYDDFSETVRGVAVSRAGNVPTDVPRRLANVWVSWSFLPQWTLSSGLRYVGKRYADNANTLALPAYTTTDLALRWQVTPDTTLTLRGFNVFNKRYYTTAYYTNTQWFVGDGRRVELTAYHRF
ncbi:iron complex outermembrane recepter protein [Variovorax sp. OK605]|uniref:TonB-dependent receptor n=1 Tax=Variovorax sp. OK605 TaxID=1855317 RepID=UPI0008EFDD95|nr:TonB-dependent receptor [Variovorax sp. OK605]SFQ14957.1 iron complex outermembrane recepter protein [Variovorax sp. OK605]